MTSAAALAKSLASSRSSRAPPAGLEPATSGLEGPCSIHLSYGGLRQGESKARLLSVVIAATCDDRHMPVRVVVTTCAVTDDPSLLALLDSSEVERAERKREPLPYISAHALVRRALGATLQTDPRSLRFERRCATCGSDRHGKPHIVGRPEWSFSLSYTGRAAVVALSRDGEVGIDVEETAEAGFGGFEQVTLAASEVPAFASLAGEELLVARAQIWARKEAILKATGHGLVVDPTEVIVSGPHEPPALIEWQADPETPHPLALTDLDRVPAGHRAAVAVLADGSIDVSWHHES